MTEQEFREYLEKFFKWIGPNIRDKTKWLDALEEWSRVEFHRAYQEKYDHRI